MDKKFVNAVKESLTNILCRLTNDITDLKIEVKEDCHGEEYYSVESNNIPMTSRVFKTLCIKGSGRIRKDKEGKKEIVWALSWHWTRFDGGSNGANLLTVITSEELRYGCVDISGIYLY